MQIFRNIQYFVQKTAKSHIVTIGNYDGVHLGHQDIFNKVHEISIATGLPSVLITFEPHPYEYFHRHTHQCYKLMNWRDKIAMFRKYKIDNVLIIPFNEQFANIEAQDFIQNILHEKLRTHALVVGENFRFGKNNLGDIALLSKYSQIYNFALYAMQLHFMNDKKISSSYIRNLLSQDKILEATKLLGHSYYISGRVIHGDKRGRTLGFPTANLALKHNLMPLSGVYLVKVYGIDEVNFSKSYFAMANIGFRPTTNNPKRLLEVHIFDFNENLYGKLIKVEFIQKIRSEQKFATLDLLQQQLNQDLLVAKKMLL